MQDDEPPQFTLCPTSIQAFANKKGFAEVSWEKLIAVDNSDDSDPCGAVAPVKITQEEGLAAGSEFSPGYYTISHSAVDGSGNIAQCTFTVKVEGKLFFLLSFLELIMNQILS